MDLYKNKQMFKVNNNIYYIILSRYRLYTDKWSVGLTNRQSMFFFYPSCAYRTYNNNAIVHFSNNECIFIISRYLFIYVWNDLLYMCDVVAVAFYYYILGVYKNGLNRGIVSKSGWSTRHRVTRWQNTMFPMNIL